RRRVVLETFFSFDVPCAVVTKRQDVPDDMQAVAARHGVAVLRSSLKTTEFYRRVKPALDEEFAPSTTLHASLADVLIGRGHELQRHHMEIRGVGVIDIPSIFGIRSVRQQKRIEVVVQLEHWE